jgi:membrane protein DedA with SNARE-associated domain
MLPKITAALAGIVIATISSGGYLGIVALMAIESACIPIPSEIIMPFSGYLVSTGRFELLLVATAGAVGCNVGSTLAYIVGRYGGRPAIAKWGGYILMSRRDLEITDRFFARFGGIAVLFGRLLPVVRTFIALPAGIARLPQLRFQIYTFIGSWPWCFGLAYIGYKLGERWNSDPRLQGIMHRLDLLVLAIVVLAFCWYVWRHLQRGGEKNP